MASELNLEDQVVRALRRITRAIDVRSRELMQHHGLTAPQLSALQAIARTQPVNAGALAREMHLGQPTVTGVLNRLERQGLIQRARGQRDRRHVEVRLTELGGEVLRSAPPLLEQNFQRRLKELKEWEQTQILATLQRIADMMDADGLDETPEEWSEPAPASDLHKLVTRVAPSGDSLLADSQISGGGGVARVPEKLDGG